MKHLLEIRDKAEQSVEIQDAHRFEIKEYLDLLDLTVEIEIRWMSDYNRRETRTVFRTWDEIFTGRSIGEIVYAG